MEAEGVQARWRLGEMNYWRYLHVLYLKYFELYLIFSIIVDGYLQHKSTIFVGCFLYYFVNNYNFIRIMHWNATSFTEIQSFITKVSSPFWFQNLKSYKRCNLLFVKWVGEFKHVLFFRNISLFARNRQNCKI